MFLNARASFGWKTLTGVLSHFIFVFRILAGICLSLVKGCIGEENSYCTCSQGFVQKLLHPRFGASWVQADLSSGSSLLTVICCSYMLKCQVLFRLCTGMKRKQKKKQQKVISGMSPSYHWGGCSCGTESGSLPLLAHPSNTAACPGKGTQSLVPAPSGAPRQDTNMSSSSPQSLCHITWNSAHLQGNGSTLINQWKNQIFNNMHQVLMLNPAGQEKLQREIFKDLTEELHRLG